MELTMQSMIELNTGKDITKKINIFDLPSNILKIVYDYDDTYREKFKSVLLEIRGNAWRKYFRKMRKTVEKTAMAHFLKETKLANGEKFNNKIIHPDNINIYIKSGKIVKTKQLCFYDCDIRNDLERLRCFCVCGSCGKRYKNYLEPDESCWENCSQKRDRVEMWRER